MRERESYIFIHSYTHTHTHTHTNKIQIYICTRIHMTRKTMERARRLSAKPGKQQRTCDCAATSRFETSKQWRTHMTNEEHTHTHTYTHPQALVTINYLLACSCNFLFSLLGKKNIAVFVRSSSNQSTTITTNNRTLDLVTLLK
jgi:hypothetical protein